MLLILDNAAQFKLAKTAIDKAWNETISHHEVQSLLPKELNKTLQWNWPLGWVDFMRDQLALLIILQLAYDGKIRAAKVPLPTKKVLNRPLNLLYHQNVIVVEKMK